MSHVKSKPCGRAAFTLVELLVVIGVIAVLIGILLPTLNRAREAAKRTQCMSNLRSLAQAIHLYANSSKDWLPNTNDPGTTALISTNGANYVLVSLANNIIKSPGIFHCPSDIDDMPSKIDTAEYETPDSARTSYEFFSIWFEPELGLKMGKKTNSNSQMAPLAWDLEGGKKILPGYQNHGTKGGNVAFVDGHAEWQEQAQWDAINMPYPGQKIWNRIHGLP